MSHSSTNHVGEGQNPLLAGNTGGEEVYERNTFLQVDQDVSKAAYILRSFTSPLAMLNPARPTDEEENVTHGDDNDGESSACESEARGGLTPPEANGERRRSMQVVPFGKFEAGQVVTQGMIGIQEKIENTPEIRDTLATPPQLRTRRVSVASVFFSPTSSHAGDGKGEVLGFSMPASDADEKTGPGGGDDTTSSKKEKKAKKVKTKAGIDRDDPQYAGQLFVDGMPEVLCTTLMVRNIPNKYTQRLLVILFKQHGFDRTFDFLYVPVDFNTRLNVGYCFINFTEPKFAQQFAKRFHGLHLPAFKSRKRIHISLANLQGLKPNIKKLLDSSLMMDTVAPEYQPLLFDCESGREMPFPTPAITAGDKIRSRKNDPDFWDKEDESTTQQWVGTIFPRAPPSDEPKKTGPPRHHNNQGNLGKGATMSMLTQHKGAGANSGGGNQNKQSPPGTPPQHAVQHRPAVPAYVDHHSGYSTPPYNYYDNHSMGFDAYAFPEMHYGAPPGLRSHAKGSGKGMYGQDSWNRTPPSTGRSFKNDHQSKH